MVTANTGQFLWLIALVLLFDGCVTPSSLRRWGHTAKTTEASLLYECTIFTGNWSAIFGGPQRSMCLGKTSFWDHKGSPPVVVAVGTRVDVRDIHTYRLIDTYYDQARVYVFLEDRRIDAYMRWPESWLIDDSSR
jgi:hypothetical protein